MNTPTVLPPSGYVPHARISIRSAFWSLVTGMALVVPIAVLVALLPLPRPDAEMVRVSTARLQPLHTVPWLLALHALVIAPIWEEFVYRGLMLQFLRRRFPTSVAVAIPTLIFAGTHFTFSYQNAVLAFITGLIFSWLAVRSSSLYPSMLCHAGVNLASLFVIRPVAIALGWKTNADIPTLVAVVVVVASTAALMWCIRTLKVELKSSPAPAATAGSVLVPASI